MTKLNHERPQTFEDWNRLFLLRQGTFTREQVEFERGEAWRCATASRDAEIAALREQLRLERVAVVLRASGLVPSCGNGYPCKAMNPKFSTYCPNCKLKDAILDLLSNSDKSFAEAHDAAICNEAHQQGFNAGFDGAERAAFERERKYVAEREAHDAEVWNRALEEVAKLAELGKLNKLSIYIAYQIRALKRGSK